MGCDFCKLSNQEPQMNIEQDNIKKIDEEYQLPDNNLNDNDFLTLLNQNLPNFGKSISQEEFNSVIPKNYKNEPLKMKPENKTDIRTYQAGPIQFKDGSIYKGTWNSKLEIEGEGEYFLKENNIFLHGFWLNNNLIYAKLYFMNGDIYEGEMKNTSFHGKGILQNNEEIYEGDFIESEKDGYGKLTYNDGVIYEGNFSKGEFKGKGKMNWGNGYTYEGEFNGQNMMGEGKLVGPDGDTYEGQFENSLFNGKGKYTFNNGNIYEGEFKYGNKAGNGVYTVFNKYIFQGNWENDLPNGIGKLTTWNHSGVLKSAWRSGNIMEDPVYESGSENNFNGINFDIMPDEMKLNPKGLTHLNIIETIDTQYKPGETFPSFLKD